MPSPMINNIIRQLELKLERQEDAVKATKAHIELVKQLKPK